MKTALPSPLSLIIAGAIALFACLSVRGASIDPTKVTPAPPLPVKTNAPTIITYARVGLGEGRMRVLKPDRTPVVIGQPFNSTPPTAPSPAVASQAALAPAAVQPTPNAWQLTWTPKTNEVYGIFSAAVLAVPTHWEEVGITTTNSGSVTIGMKRTSGLPVTNMFFKVLALSQ